jgi:hypothetical protein
MFIIDKISLEKHIFFEQWKWPLFPDHENRIKQKQSIGGVEISDALTSHYINFNYIFLKITFFLFAKEVRE